MANGRVCSVCEESWEKCGCSVDQSYDGVEMASLRQEIRHLRRTEHRAIAAAQGLVRYWKENPDCCQSIMLESMLIGLDTALTELVS